MKPGGGPFRAQDLDDYAFEAQVLPENTAIAPQLIVLPFSVSLQRHYLVKDPVFERSRYPQMGKSFGDTVNRWAEVRGYDSQILDAAGSSNLFASQRVTSTSIRQLNKKGSIAHVPPLRGLVRELKPELQIKSGSLIMAGSYIGHNKSNGQLLKERVSSGMRFLSSLGRKQFRRPPGGFGKLFVVMLEGDTGRLVWFSDAEASPENANQVLAGVLTQYKHSRSDEAYSVQATALPPDL